ncbi:copper-translocating P-type ATPase [Candidatus Kaiserbacteria bacterium CG10_big_fil_rev_8_21_14_0_10_56_12]|uniref:Copper-translocating P-type ATPase n=1 Tax=Candidatus Kaiserbacteria bacterium CG10_big_fil_rev_8_21_14_0_10_56_12 TaxID=1974611 RepID=A0A2H0UAX0_9BACT|nr:MAG: copper-translocating P-type ATPase [Candidatus Kaiserbacteria bacterium CG10_big_fil_rev_8_21_14_0_10_56_12]
MNTHTYPVRGMHCASCASIIEKTLQKVDGVHHIEVNPGTEAAKISFDHARTSLEALSREIEPLGYTLVTEHAHEEAASHSGHGAHTGMNQTKEEKIREIAHLRGLLWSAAPLALISLGVMGWHLTSSLGLVPQMSAALRALVAWLLPLMATYVLFVVGQPYLRGLYRFLRHGAANMDTLVGLGTLTAFLYSVVVTVFAEPLRAFVDVSATYYDVTIIVITFITLGKYLEARAKVKTGDAIEKLLNLQVKTALVVRDGREREIAIDQVVHGDQIVVKPASRIPVDGIVSEGESYVDESMITGEPMPVKKGVSDAVVAGTMNTSGTFVFTATKVGSETMLARIVEMVEEAQGSRAPIQTLADQISTVFVPVVLVIAFVTLGVWLLVGTHYLGFSLALAYGLTSFVGVLVIACPCALGLATPTAIIVGVGKGAHEGILVKDAATLEMLHKADVVVVDKTGTLTRGKPELVSLENDSDKSDEEIVRILVSLESKSEHPIAGAIVAHEDEKKIVRASVDAFTMLKGKGIAGRVGGVTYHVGGATLARELGAAFDSLEQHTREGKTPVLLLEGARVLAVAMVADAIKSEAITAVKDLHALGIHVVMLTGDDVHTARYIANQVGIDEVVAEVLPEDKLNKIKELQQQGRVVAMAGDGVNDAPALAQADVGIAMATGTDVAIESAGITLLHGDISKLVKAVRLSKLTMRGIKQNLFWAFIYNIVGIPLAGGLFYPVFGWLISPIFAGLAMALSSVSVVSNSLRIKLKAV